MSIASRIEQIEQHLKDDYDVLELAGADLTNVDKNIFNLKQSWEERLLYFLANGTDVVWNNWLPKINGTGETITLNNTIEAKMDVVYKGNTSQFSTTGKNLFNIDTITGFYQNLATYSNGLITTISFTESTPNIIPYFSNINLSSGTCYISMEIRLKSGSGSFSKINDGSVDWERITKPTLSNTFQKYVYRHTYNNTKKLSTMLIQFSDSTNAVYEIKNIMISTSSDTTYEPYTNGASPNPDYPQDIQVVSGDNTIKVEGKNLFKIPLENGSASGITWTINENGSITLNGTSTTHVNINSPSINMPVIEGETYTISATNILAGNIGFKELNGTDIWVLSEYLLTKTKIITSDMQTTNVKFSIYIPPNSTFDNVTITFQLEKGSTATTYEAYKGASYPISLGNIELCKIGTYQDSIVKDNGKWYLNKQIGKVVLDGSENWVHEAGSQTPTPRTVVTINSINFLNNNYYSNYFILNSTTSNRIVLRTENSQLYLSLENELAGIINSDTNQQKVDKIKSWLSTHNTTVYYVLATPTNTLIEDTTLIYQLEAIKKSYNSQTNISQENNDLPFELDVVALGKLS